MAVTAVGRELEKREARYLALCCRIAAELGARVVKTYWCEEILIRCVRLSGAGHYGRRAQVRDRTGGPGICA